MAKSKRLEQIENTFGRETAGLFALTEFFDACEGKSQSAIDRLADTARNYLPSDLQTACREHRAPKRRKSERQSTEFTADDVFRARGLGIRWE